MSSQWRQRVWATALITALAGVVAAAVTTAAQSTLLGRSIAQPQQRAPVAIEEIRRLLQEDGSKARFDGIVHGWRIAPDSALEAEGIGGRHLSRSCEPTAAGAETPTQLDFTLTYFPPEITIGEVSGPIKWLCAGEGLSVLYAYTLDTPLGSGDLWVYRALWGHRALGMLVPDDSIEAATINGKPAIFVHPADDTYGLGVGEVIVIEDDAAPEFTILRVFADNGVPFVELVKIAEGVK